MTGLGRINSIQRAVATDYDAYEGTEKPSDAFLPLRWASIALSILNLPVAPWNDPGTVSGEIDTAARQTKERRTHMTWNNGNGNGYGQAPQQGYGQPQGAAQGGYVDDPYARLNHARTPSQDVRDPFIEHGEHLLVLLELKEYTPTQGAAPKVRATFEYVQSTNPQLVGQRTCKIWKITEPPKFPGAISEGEEMIDFLRKLKGAPDGTVMTQDARTLLRERANDNLARGTQVACIGARNQKGNYVKVYWRSVANTPAEIQMRRAQLDARLGGGGGAPQQPQGYAQPQQPPQGFVPQGAPAMPPQGQQQFAPPPANAYGAPQGAPVQPQQPFVPQGAPVQPQQAPQGQGGGFLAQIPGWGGNGNGTF